MLNGYVHSPHNIIELMYENTLMTKDILTIFLFLIFMEEKEVSHKSKSVYEEMKSYINY